MHELRETWSLTLDEPLPEAAISWIAPAKLPDGRGAILKIVCPEPEVEHEADALALWDGQGAARLIARDEIRWALLIERLVPGTPLWSIPERPALDVVADLLRRLHAVDAPETPFRPLAAEAARWVAALPGQWEAAGRPFPRRLIDKASAFVEGVPAPARSVVLHQDLHGTNVLRSGDGWRAIDPKPLVGDPAFDLASAIRDRRAELARDPRPRSTLDRRVDVLSEALGLDREVVRGWAHVHALAWGFDAGSGAPIPELIACADWLAR